MPRHPGSPWFRGRQRLTPDPSTGPHKGRLRWRPDPSTGPHKGRLRWRPDPSIGPHKGRLRWRPYPSPLIAIRRVAVVLGPRITANVQPSDSPSSSAQPDPLFVTKQVMHGRSNNLPQLANLSHWSVADKCCEMAIMIIFGQPGGDNQCCIPPQVLNGDNLFCLSRKMSGEGFAVRPPLGEFGGVNQYEFELLVKCCWRHRWSCPTESREC